MASTTPSVTPRLRMTRHGPSASITATYDRSTQSASLSEAGPSRLPEFSQLVDVDFDMSLDDNMYASDSQTDRLDAPSPAARSSGTPTPKFTAGTLPMSTTPPSVTRSEKDKENPAAVLRALLSRLPPNRDNEDDMETPTRLNPMPNPVVDDDERYPFEKESDYEAETASATHSVAQSSLKDIFSKALREPGDTPTKDRSVLGNGSASRSRTVGRRRRSSIGASEVDETPRFAESMTLKGKRKSMSDDELEHLVRSSDKSKPRSRGLPQALTKEFLRERFGSSSTSPTKPQAAANESGQEISFPDLNSSRNTPPAATSTPQQSLWMSFGGDSNFQSNLLEQDSEMHKAIKAFGGSTETDSESDRSISPPPTLRAQNEPEEEHEAPRISSSSRNGEASTSGTHRVPGAAPHFNSRLPAPTSPKSGSDMSMTNGFDTHDQNDYNGGSLGEESMSLSLPAGHQRLHPELSHRSRSSNSIRGGSMTPLAHQKSSSSLRPFSPMPGQHPESPMPDEGVKERERNWNKPRKSLEMPSMTHLHSHSHARSSPHPHLVRHDSNTSLRSMAASPTPSRSGSRASMSSLQSPPPGVTSPTRERHTSFHGHARSPSHPSLSHTPSWSPAHPHIRSRTTSISSVASDDRSTGSVSPFSMGHHRRPSTPSDLDPEVVHERERNWNAPHPKWHDGMPLNGHNPKEKSLSVASPDARSRANSLQHATPPHPHLHHSHSHSHARTQSPSYTPQSTRAISPQLTRRSALSTTTPTTTPQGITRSRSPLPASPSRASSLKSIGNTYQSNTPTVKRHLTSPSVPTTKKKAQVDVGSSVSTSGMSTSNVGLSAKSSSSRKTATGAKSSRIPVPHATPSGKSRSGKHLGEDLADSPKAERAIPVPIPFPQEPSSAPSPSPYAWPEMEEEQHSANEFQEEKGAENHTHTQDRHREHDRGMETDDLHDTDFSQSENEQDQPQEPESESENDTPRTKFVEPPVDSQDEMSEPIATSTPFRPSTREHGRISPLPVANFDETVQNGVLSTDDESATPTSPTPSTPPRQATPKLGRVEFATPSPPRNLPELPTPSSSDESLRTSPHRKPMLRTPRFGQGETNDAGIATPLNPKTPKPPGGWLATPAPPVQPVQEAEETEEGSNTEGPSTSFDNGRLPMDVLDAFPDTPVNGPGDFTLGKTPKPPGGWLATPAPSKLSQQLTGTDPSSPEDDGQRSQLLTPVSSLSKGSALNMKTPGVPGGWGATPGPATARKSVLKVRFDPQSPEVQDTTESDEGVKDREESRKKAKIAKTDVAAGVAQVDLPPSPRSPSRKSKSNIRILDAFGREESVRSSPPRDVTANKSAFRVLDALGREVKEEETVKEETIVDQSKLETDGDAALPRDELLLKLRKGLVELVDDIADLDGDEELSPDKRTRIRELLATSRQSRSTRQRLHAQSKTPVIPSLVVKTSFISWSPRTILVLVFVQFIVLIVLYRICVGRARAQYMNYYDPFNPELHFYIFKSDPTIHASRLGSIPNPSARALLPTGGIDWKHWFRHLEGLQGYIGKFWNTDIPRRRYLIPA